MRASVTTTVLALLLLTALGCSSMDESLAGELQEKVLQPLEAARQQSDSDEIKRQCTAFEMALEAPDVKKLLKGDGAQTKAVVEKLRASCEGVDTGVRKSAPRKKK